MKKREWRYGVDELHRQVLGGVVRLVQEGRRPSKHGGQHRKWMF